MKLKKHIPLVVRIIISILFIVSAISKMFPIWAWEKQLVDLGITTWCQAHFLARFIIAGELAIGIAILQNHFLKRIVIPGTILLLLVFCVHLSIQIYQHGAMSGNCGCMGQAIPMTPLEALIKNLITIGLLIYLYKNVQEKVKGQNKFIYLIFMYLSTSLFMFVFFPFCPCKTETSSLKEHVLTKDTIQNRMNRIALDTLQKKENIRETTIPKVNKEKVPQKVNSKFSSYSVFGGQKVDLNEGKKIICLFAASCDHCLETAKEICSLSSNNNFPRVYILFMDEESFKIPDFFDKSGCNFPYQIINIMDFWDLLGKGGNTPGVFYLWNGNIIKSFVGIEDNNKFNPIVLKKTIDLKWGQIKH